jgi:hypothetical protein
MRKSFDCVVIGRGAAACLAAGHLAARGVCTALAPPTTNRQPGAILVPDHPPLLAALARLGLDAGVLDEMSEQRLEFESVGCGAHPPSEVTRHWRVSAERFARACREAGTAAGLEVLAEGAEAVGRTILAARCQHEAQGAAIKQAERAHYLITGLYRDVTQPPGEAGRAQIYGARAGARFWLAPLSEGLTSLGLVLENQPLKAPMPASVWEEELVHCPQLVERLLAAQLAGNLVLQSEAVACEAADAPAWPRRLVLPVVGTTVPDGLGWPTLVRAWELAEQAIALSQGSIRRERAGGHESFSAGSL